MKNNSNIDGVPCGHSGCLNHVTHPCEGCGRIAGRDFTDYLNIENGKYTLIFWKDGGFEIYRGGKTWMQFPINGSKMLIAMMYEILDSRTLLSQVEDKCFGLRHVCDMIHEHSEKYQFDLRPNGGLENES